MMIYHQNGNGTIIKETINVELCIHEAYKLNFY